MWQAYISIVYQQYINNSMHETDNSDQ